MTEGKVRVGDPQRSVLLWCAVVATMVVIWLLVDPDSKR